MFFSFFHFHILSSNQTLPSFIDAIYQGVLCNSEKQWQIRWSKEIRMHSPNPCQFPHLATALLYIHHASVRVWAMTPLWKTQLYVIWVEPLRNTVLVVLGERHDLGEGDEASVFYQTETLWIRKWHSWPHSVLIGIVTLLVNKL